MLYPTISISRIFYDSIFGRKYPTPTLACQNAELTLPRVLLRLSKSIWVCLPLAQALSGTNHWAQPMRARLSSRHVTKGYISQPEPTSFSPLLRSGFGSGGALRAVLSPVTRCPHNRGKISRVLSVFTFEIRSFRLGPLWANQHAPFHVIPPYKLAVRRSFLPFSPSAQTRNPPPKNFRNSETWKT